MTTPKAIRRSSDWRTRAHRDLAEELQLLRDENAMLKVTVDRAIAEVVRHWTEKHAWKAEALAARKKSAAA